MRIDVDTFREIADSLTRNKSRSLLTGFGIFWGIFMLLFLVGGGQGVKAMLLKNFEGFATNSMFVVPSRTSKPFKGFSEGRSWSFTYKDVDRLRMMVPEFDVVAPVIIDNQKATYGTKNFGRVSIKGIYPEYTKIEEPVLKYGRTINETDVIQQRKVCVIGKRIYNTLFPEGGDPCGKFIQIGSIYYQIVGVDYSSGNISVGGRADRTATIPLSVAKTLRRRGDKVDFICMTAKPGVRMSTLEERVRQISAREHKFDPTDKQALFVLNAEQLFTLVDNLFKGLNFLIWLIGLGTVLAGAIGVSNIMMVTVKERTSEIGIRRAIGAAPSSILFQIIMESISLTLVAGASGIVFSVLILAGVDAVSTSGATFQISFWTAVTAALMLTVLGVLAGLAPASRAMKIKPVDAMREE